MPYSDEPKLIKERVLGPQQWLIGGLILLITLLIGGSLLWQWNHNRIRDHLPRGEHGGFIHAVSAHGWEVEVIRAPDSRQPEMEKLYVCVITADDTHTHVAGLTVQARKGSGEWMDLPWNSDFELYGPAEVLRFDYNRDRRVELRIMQEGATAWERRLWAYSNLHALRGHGHGHSH